MAVITAVRSGRWTDPTIWDLGRVPTYGDTVVIPSNVTVTYDVALFIPPNLSTLMDVYVALRAQLVASVIERAEQELGKP